METNGFIVTESGETFGGRWLGGESRAGELVFNTSHSGYEEIASDPSYFGQIMIMTAPMQGNYGALHEWESTRLHVQGFAALELQHTGRDSGWVDSLVTAGIPVIDSVDTRRLVLFIRENGTPWGAVVKANSATEAKTIAKGMIEQQKKLPKDWVYAVSLKTTDVRQGKLDRGPRVAVIDFGTKENILCELQKRSKEVGVFNSRVSATEIRNWNPDGILLTNGPGDPGEVQEAVKTVQVLLGWKPIFGICMGHQILSLALGAKTFKMPFGHRGANHPVRDEILKEVYMTSQNHGYSVDPQTLPSQVQVTHTNLYDKTIEGISYPQKKCFSVQFHPENCPGPRDSVALFDYFKDQLL